MNKIQYIEIIKKCPYCNSDLIIIDNNGIKILKCNNEQCPQRLINRIEHFCSKTHGIDIKGLGKRTISLLCNWGWINELGDIYKLNRHKAEWISKPNFGEASVGKILLSIEASRSGAQLENFISALGIPLVGRTVAKVITKYYSTWEDFREAIGTDWTEFEGFGPEITKAINTFDYTEADDIATHFLTFKDTEAQSDGSPNTAIKDKAFCITGKVTHYKNRDALKVEIESLGGRVVSSVTSKTDYLINNDSTSTTSKNLTAQKLSVPIITEEEFLKMKG